MNTGGWIVLGVAVVVIAGGAVYMTMTKGTGDKSATGDATEKVVGTNANEKEVVKGTVQDLVTRGGSRKCAFKHATDAGDSTGVMYVSDGKIRGDFVSRPEGTAEVKSHMIVKDGVVYTWSDMMPQGFKMPMTGAATAQVQGQANFYAQPVDYDCSSWNADASVFEVPSTVTFLQMGS